MGMVLSGSGWEVTRDSVRGKRGSGIKCVGLFGNGVDVRQRNGRERLSETEEHVERIYKGGGRELVYAIG